MDNLLELIESLPKQSQPSTSNDTINHWLQSISFVDNANNFKEHFLDRSPLHDWNRHITFFNYSSENISPKIHRSKQRNRGSLFAQALAARCKPEFVSEANAIRHQLISTYLAHQAENYHILASIPSTTL